MSQTFTNVFTDTFHVVCCWKCGCRFGVPSQLYDKVANKCDGELHCIGCGVANVWRVNRDKKRIKELEVKLEWEVRNANMQREARKAAESSLIATKGVVTRMKRRVGAGMCPCCKRTFHQLAAHMKMKHPEFGDGKEQV